MNRPRHTLALLAALVLGTGSATLAATPVQALGTPMPAHVYAPYFETWTTEVEANLERQAGSAS